ncbi:MAG TPA: hypothetical protein VHX68_21125 [Planctomycetaceae bacterium]|nr:hypothetical protein [Planctomycetaceae bacterium]
MPDNKPMWTAVRLNQFIAGCGDAPVGLAPPGGVLRRAGVTWTIAAEEVGKRVDQHSAAAPSAKNEATIADICFLNVTGIETATTNLARLPMLLAISAFDPEAWCTVIVHPGALETAGPFRDVPSPLREWLLRAAVAGHSPMTLRRFRQVIRIPDGVVLLTGTGKGGHSAPKSLLEAAHDAGLGSMEPEPTAGALVGPCVLQESSLPSLGPECASKTPPWLAECLQTLTDRQFDCNLKAGPDAIALAAGVWQMNGFLDRSHELAQSVEGGGKNRAGDYWHAIMHRREPDYSNAKYWCRRVGQHAIHDFLVRDADDILSGCKSADAPRWRSALTGKGRQIWDSFAFVDLCEDLADDHDPELSLAARQIQTIEMALLLSSTYHDAVA